MAGLVPPNLKFEDGEPINASAFRALLQYVTEVGTYTLTVPGEATTLANQTIASKFTAGTKSLGTVDLTTAQKSFDIAFNPPLNAAPAAILITIETSSGQSEPIYFIEGGSTSSSGCRVVLSRGGNAVGDTIKKLTGVKIHYFAMAKTS